MAAFQIARPERRRTPVVFAAPHSGRDYPRAFLNKAEIDPLMLRSSEDAFVDLLFSGAVDHGAVLLCATVFILENETKMRHGKIKNNLFMALIYFRVQYI